jgi:tRNA modification GTPase
VIEVHLDLRGYPVTLLDTAGIRETEDPVELEGVRRARARAAEADLVLWVTDAREPVPADVDQQTDARWLVPNKIDLGGNPAASATIFPVSATSGAGVDRLVDGLARFAQAYFGATEAALITRARHRAALDETHAALLRALSVPEDREEVIAEELRLAARGLGRLTGRVDVEDILDVIFRDFCIGK